MFDEKPACLPPLLPPPPPPGLLQSSAMGPNSRRWCNRHRSDPTEDPNVRAGPGGCGLPLPQRKIHCLITVHFQNVRTGDLSAQDVVITDQLDPSKVDLKHLQPGPIEFGDRAVTAAGTECSTTAVGLRRLANNSRCSMRS